MRDLSAYDDLFTNPAWFLAGIDADARVFRYLRTSETLIQTSSFLDGRTPIAVDDVGLNVPFEAAATWSETAPSIGGPDRILAHVSFCGSTLLARLLQGDGQALGYNEPQVMVQLATLKAKAHPATTDHRTWTLLVRFALSQYRKAWGGAPTFMKPSNWVNTMLPDLMSASPDLKLVVIETGPEDYLIANLRGGKARLSYSLNLLNHFLSANQTYRAQVLEVERAGLAPTQRLLRLLMIIFETQQNILGGALSRVDGDDAVRVSKDQLQTQPIETTQTVARGFDLALKSEGIGRAVERDMAHHAKDQALRFRPDLEAAENVKLRQSLSADFDAVLDWRQTQLRSVA